MEGYFLKPKKKKNYYKPTHKKGDPINKILGEIIKRERVLKKLTQQDMAKLFNLTQAQWSSYEKGQTSISFRLFLDFCNCKKIKADTKKLFAEFLDKASD